MKTASMTKQPQATHSRRQVSYHQRAVMLSFMKSHPEFARGRLVCADGARTRLQLLEQMGTELNCVGNGATKSPEKWLKCWQDWKSDVKSKAAKYRRYKSGTGGGPSLHPLSELEEDIINFIGVEAVEGVAVPDPLAQEDASSRAVPEPEFMSDNEPEVVIVVDPEPRETKKKSGEPEDPLMVILKSQADAISTIAEALTTISIVVTKIAKALDKEDKDEVEYQIIVEDD